MTDISNKPLVLAILDGWGFSKKKMGNPIAAAAKPTMDMLDANYPRILLQASGLAVGMTWGESGNSEVGHLNIGSGRIVEQYLSRINHSVSDGSFFTNPALVGAFDHARKNNGRVHIIGLLTSGTVHADFSHIPVLLELAAQKQQLETYVHLFLDGRDSGLQESPALLAKLQEGIKARGYGKLATLIGRSFAMDRDNNWEFTRQAYELLAEAKGEKSLDYVSSIRSGYDVGLDDSSMKPIVVSESGFGGIADNDALIFFNFREDSMRQILRPFIEPNFSQFSKQDLKNIYVSTMTQYLENPLARVAFMPPIAVNGLAEILEKKGKKQCHIAETEKYAHVTFFFNGLRNQKFDGEADEFIESDKDYVRNPAMKSQEIAQKVIEELDKGERDFIILNFANADMLAHTGDYAATVAGIEAVDGALGRIYEAVLQKNGILVITSDHGNAESLTYRGSGEAETRHDDSPVPFYLIGHEFQTTKSAEKQIVEVSEVSGILADVAPTLLELMGIPQPKEMTGKSLLPILTSGFKK